MPLPGSAEPRGVLVTEIDLEGERVLLAATHLGLDAGERAAQKEAITAVLPPDAPVVLCGDFNEPPQALGAIAGRFTLAPPVASYPAAEPTVAIDLLLTSEHWRVEQTRAIPTGASDHLPVVADMVAAVPIASDASSRA